MTGIPSIVEWWGQEENRVQKSNEIGIILAEKLSQIEGIISKNQKKNVCLTPSSGMSTMAGMNEPKIEPKVEGAYFTSRFFWWFNLWDTQANCPRKTMPKRMGMAQLVFQS